MQDERGTNRKAVGRWNGWSGFETPKRPNAEMGGLAGRIFFYGKTRENLGIGAVDWARVGGRRSYGEREAARGSAARQNGTATGE